MRVKVLICEMKQTSKDKCVNQNCLRLKIQITAQKTGRWCADTHRHSPEVGQVMFTFRVGLGLKGSKTIRGLEVTSVQAAIKHTHTGTLRNADADLHDTK